MADSKPSTTPLSASVLLLKDQGNPLSAPTEYRQIVGSLQYLSLTRPDVAFVTNRLSQYMQNPTEEHWSALKQFLLGIRNVDLPNVQSRKT
ncbi:hypothetical protein V2J09_000271 [Rumex salicifolius]